MSDLSYDYVRKVHSTTAALEEFNRRKFIESYANALPEPVKGDVDAAYGMIEANFESAFRELQRAYGRYIGEEIARKLINDNLL